MKVVFALWGLVGFFVCGAALLMATPALMMIPSMLLLWIGGMVGLGFASIIDRQY